MANFPIAAGHPDYAGVMFPEVWSSKILVKFYHSTILSEISNTDYEGEIKNQGDTVHIRTTPSITITDHIMGQEVNYETPVPTVIDLVINKGKKWAFVNDDIAKSQSDYAFIEDWTGDAAKQLKIAIETAVLADVYASAHAKNKGATAGMVTSGFNLGATSAPIALDKTNIVDYIVDMGSVLDEQNVPEDGRYLIMPAWACGLVKKSDIKDAAMTGDSKSILRTNNEALGMIDRFHLYKSNLLARTVDGSVTATNMMFGHKSALTFAAQLVKSEGPMRDVKVFGDHYRGLNVYGYKVVKSEAMGHFYAYKG
jgi:hypothetical protein